jgi:MinD-like ATPase involved in chromosome partitioning or flagellar assembly
MTVAVFASVKGAPGVTTVVNLVAATWPEQRRALVVECDPSGGDIAARFQLSSRCGWSSFETASRRGESIPDIGPHLQQLPGGLEVLVGARQLEGSDTGRMTTAIQV